MKVINLYNRYRNKLKLIEESDNVYFLSSSDPFDLQYMRVGYKDNNKNEIEFIDPSGGPFIKINSFEVNNKIVDKIYYKYNKYYINVK